MPWCRIDKTYEVGEIQIVPFERHEPIDGLDDTAQCRVNTILASYKTIVGKPVDRAAFVRYGGRLLIDGLNDKEQEAIYELVTLACFCGLARREYYEQGGHYCNSECFSLYIQKFDEADSVSLRTRRRDGHTWDVWPIADIAITIPAHCQPVREVNLDEALLKELVAHRAQSADEEWARWQNAISCFNQANTDGENVRYQVEWVLLCSAFEHILGAESNARDVAEKFAEAVAPSSPVLAGNAERRSDRWTDANKPIRYEWMKEFYRIRGDFAHGRLQTNQPSVWNSHEHLVLAAITFPVLVRCLLNKKGWYEFTDNDLAQIDAFEKLADEQFLKPPSNQKSSLDWVWPRLVQDAKSEVLRRKARNDPEIQRLWSGSS
ncbi:MAG TPA: hypothetical protein VN666_04555 [Nitrospira sp.]|nr:hypothetical protein [Nitrospira sp.]